MSRFFDGSNDYVRLGSSPVTTLGTYFCWFNSDSATADQTLMGIFSSSDNTPWVRLVLRGATAGDPVMTDQNSGAGYSGTVTTTGYTAGKWHTAALVIASATSKTVYIDEGSSATNTNNYTGSTDRTSAGLLDRPTPAEPFLGRIAYVHVYNRVLTVAELRQLRRFPGSIRNGLIIFWPLAGSALARELDYTGRGNHGLVSGALAKSDNPPLGNPFNFPPRFNLPIRKFYPRRLVGLGISAVITGTVTTAVESDIVAGGKTIIITLTGDTWIAAGAGSFDLQRDEIIAGLDSAQSELLGWDNTVKALQAVTGVVRTSDTVVTITLDAQATYSITSNETITVTVPATAVSGGNAIVASPTFTVTNEGAADVYSGRGVGRGIFRGVYR